MKILGLIVSLIFIHCCAAATNRSTVWLLGNTQVFTTASSTSQGCFISATGRTTLSSSTAIFTTSNLAITGQFAQLANGVANAASVYVTSNSVLYNFAIQFIYNSTYSITLTIPAQATASTSSLNIATLLTPGATTYWTSTVSSSTTNSFPIVYGADKILSPTGSTWLAFQNVPAVLSTATTFSTGIIITDYVSSSTIALTHWQDNDNTANLLWNSFYQIGVRTKTSTVSSSSSMLTTTTCTAAGRKRSVDHLLRNKRAITACASASSIDPSMTSSILSTTCTALNTIATGTAVAATATATNSDLPGAFLKHVIAMNAMYETDYAVFGAGSSKYAIAANFGMLIALSSIIFSILN